LRKMEGQLKANLRGPVLNRVTSGRTLEITTNGRESHLVTDLPPTIPLPLEAALEAH
jgi:hypothetical protein